MSKDMDLDVDYCGFASDETERSESTDNLNASKPKSVGSSGHANLRGFVGIPRACCSGTFHSHALELVPQRMHVSIDASVGTCGVSAARLAYSAALDGKNGGAC